MIKAIPSRIRRMPYRRRKAATIALLKKELEANPPVGIKAVKVGRIRVHRSGGIDADVEYQPIKPVSYIMQVIPARAAG